MSEFEAANGNSTKESVNPAGAVTVMLFDKFEPPAVKDCIAETWLVLPVNTGKMLVLTTIDGGGLVTTPLRGTLLVAPPPESARLPSRLFVAGALVEIRTATTPPVEASVKELEPGVAKEFAEISKKLLELTTAMLLPPRLVPVIVTF